MSARNFPRSLTSPSHSVLTNLSPIMPASARESRLTWASFQRCSSAMSWRSRAWNVFTRFAQRSKEVSVRQAITGPIQLTLGRKTIADCCPGCPADATHLGHASSMDYRNVTNGQWASEVSLRLQMLPAEAQAA